MPARRVVSRSTAPTSAPSTSSPSAPPTSTPPSGLSTTSQSEKRNDADETSGFVGSLSSLWRGYQQQTSSRLKLIDGFMFFLMLTGVAQFVYCVVVTNYPFNAFLGGFAATVGQFVLCGALRIQTNPDNKSTFPSISPERAFGDFLFGSLILHFFVWNYLG
ncbi:dolichyl-diphosphooligosaccharide-protein glycotransferase [Sporobolomyces koalae]|uniref:dolichyl-diphosphooligosaccharide-protein glycotransferase n=1 Tax=Sporobolomyces koalae TaxID=500713 RepID=UPI00317697CB